MSCHLCSNHLPAEMGLGGGGGNCRGVDVEIVDGELGSCGMDVERSGKDTGEKACRICSEEAPNQKAEKISLEESLQQQLILSY